MFIATLYFSDQARKAYRKTRKEIGNVNAELQESIAAVREVQAFNRVDENIENFKEVNAANRDANVRAVSFTAALSPTLEALGYVALAIVTGVGGWYMLSGQTLLGTVVTFGLIVTFLAYVQRFNQPIQQIAVLWGNIQNAIAGAERIFGLLDGDAAQGCVRSLFDAFFALRTPAPERVGEALLDRQLELFIIFWIRGVRLAEIKSSVIERLLNGIQSLCHSIDHARLRNK